MAELISALFDTRERCDRAVELLAREGFSPNEVELLGHAPPAPVGAGRDDVPSTPAEEPLVPAPPTPAPDVPEDVINGATVGSASGMALGAIAAGVGSVILPGAGLAASALAGVALGGAAGGTLGALIALGLDPHGAKPTDERLREGGFIVGVRAAGDRRNVALETLKRAGGESFKVS